MAPEETNRSSELHTQELLGRVRRRGEEIRQRRMLLRGLIAATLLVAAVAVPAAVFTGRPSSSQLHVTGHSPSASPQPSSARAAGPSAKAHAGQGLAPGTASPSPATKGRPEGSTVFDSGGLRFSYPAAWYLNAHPDEVSSFYATIVWVANQPLQPPCTTSTAPNGDRTTACGWPVSHLRAGGVVFGWNSGGMPDARPGQALPGTPVTVGEHPAGEQDAAPGDCADIGGAEAVNVTVAMPGGETDNLLACVAGPDLAGGITELHTILRSTSFRGGEIVTGLSPAVGSDAGGTKVNIDIGWGQLSQVTQVMFGDQEARSFSVISPTRVVAVSPPSPYPSGLFEVPVTLRTPDGTVGSEYGSGQGVSQSHTYPNSFTWEPPPRLDRISPAHGPTSGGTAVTIYGSGFTDATAVSFGATPARRFTVVSFNEIDALSPAEPVGQVDIRVTTPVGTSPVIHPYDEFLFGPG